MIKEKATRNLSNYLSSYTLQESTELLDQVFDHVTEGVQYAALNGNSKKQMLDFLESIEELLPAVYEIHEKRTK